MSISMSSRLYAIVGPNGSGKSSVIRSTELDIVCPFIINPDNFARCIKDVDDETERYLSAMRFCEKLRHMMLESNMEFGFETVGSRPDKLDFIRDAKNRGYSIVLVFVTTGDPEICISRIAQRVAAGGHGVPDDKVRSRYVRTMSMLPQYLDLADEAILCDNGGDSPRVVAVKRNGVVSMSDNVPGWIRDSQL